MSLLDHYAEQLDQLRAQGNLRQFTALQSLGREIQMGEKRMLNFASNDYMGLAADLRLREQFFDQTAMLDRVMSSSSSRLLTGNFPAYEQLEQCLRQAFGRAALLLNSGYHMNIGILPALSDSRTLILADKLVHASMIDGIRLSSAKYLRYRHNDLAHLQQLLQQYHADQHYDRIIVVTESIFSMDGDETDLTQLVQLKQQFDKVMLYVDEAHAIGVRGSQGLGCAEQHQVIAQIDFLVGTFGKALASVGGYLICDPIIREYLINRMRPLIFSTAQPPICMAWTQFVFEKSLQLDPQRQYLQRMSQQLQQAVRDKGYACPSSSQIIPIVVGASDQAVQLAQQLQQAGLYIMPVRPPTVPQNSSRLRICMNTHITDADLDLLMQHL